MLLLECHPPSPWFIGYKLCHKSTHELLCPFVGLNFKTRNEEHMLFQTFSHSVCSSMDACMGRGLIVSKSVRRENDRHLMQNLIDTRLSHFMNSFVDVTTFRRALPFLVLRFCDMYLQLYKL